MEARHYRPVSYTHLTLPTRGRRLDPGDRSTNKQNKKKKPT